LFLALLAGAEVQGDAGVMSERLSAAVNWSNGVMPTLSQALAQLAGEARSKSFPALHHSAMYEQAYRPSYRVVLASLWGET
jgi:hypothetical protein